MPLWIPHKGLLRMEHNTGAVGSATPGTAVTTGAASATKGSPVQLLAATSFDYYWLTVIASDYSLAATASEGSMDIMVGGAGVERVLIADLLMGNTPIFIGEVAGGCKRWDFPLYIPKGTRISARAAGVRVSTAMRVWVYGYGGDEMPPFRVGTRVTTYGITTVPRGTTVTPGASGVEGAWAAVTAATTEYHFAIVPSFQCSTDTTMSSLAYSLDIGMGPAAGERQIAEGYWFVAGANESLGGPMNTMPLIDDIPSGSRLSVRVSNSGINDAAYDAALHCVS
jgi:hypothetical protein